MSRPVVFFSNLFCGVMADIVLTAIVPSPTCCPGKAHVTDCTNVPIAKGNLRLQPKRRCTVPNYLFGNGCWPCIASPIQARGYPPYFWPSGSASPKKVRGSSVMRSERWWTRDRSLFPRCTMSLSWTKNISAVSRDMKTVLNINAVGELKSSEYWLRLNATARFGLFRLKVMGWPIFCRPSGVGLIRDRTWWRISIIAIVKLAKCLQPTIGLIAKQGVFHYMSREHLSRYLDEVCFRWNHRLPELKQDKQGTLKIVMRPMPVIAKLRSLLSRAPGCQIRRTQNGGILNLNSST
jgi:hypothetical protein